MDIREISRQIGINEGAAVAAIGGPMKLAHFKASEHLRKRRAMQSGERMVADIEFVENELPVLVAEMEVGMQENRRLRAKIEELQTRLNRMEGPCYD